MPRPVKPRILTLTQSTYDGVLYNTETIKKMLDGYVENLHFDEAWLPHAAFHPFYGMYHAMGKNRRAPRRRWCTATQSIHKLLAGISQASHVLVQDSQNGQAGQTPLQRGLPDAHLHQPAVQHHRQLRRGRRHDGAARRHRAGGRKHCRGAGLPPRHAQGGRRVRHDWWFKVWGPEVEAEEGIGEAEPTGSSRPRAERRSQRQGQLARFGRWPMASTCSTRSRVTIVTPGLDLNGKFAKTGIPASIVTKFLAEHGVVVEKTGLYSFFIMFTIGITKGRWNTLLTALQQFKDDYDKNQPMWRIMPGSAPTSALRAHGPARPVPAEDRRLPQVLRRINAQCRALSAISTGWWRKRR